MNLMRTLGRHLAALTILGTALYSSGCSSKAIDENNPEELYKEAEADIDSKRYLQAAERLRAVKNKFPYSHYSPMAAVRLADVAYLEENYAEAAAAFEIFQDLHPKYERADYVIFMIGKSYFSQTPDSIDRDMSPGFKAIEAFAQLERMYPNSSHMAEAKQYAVEMHNRLAKKELYIGDFYYVRSKYESAAQRYEKITKNFTGTTEEEDAYERWAQSLNKQKLTDEAKHVWRVYLDRFPEGRFAARAKKEL